MKKPTKDANKNLIEADLEMNELKTLVALLFKYEFIDENAFYNLRVKMADDFSDAARDSAIAGGYGDEDEPDLYESHPEEIYGCLKSPKEKQRFVGKYLSGLGEVLSGRC